MPSGSWNCRFLASSSPRKHGFGRHVDNSEKYRPGQSANIGPSGDPGGPSLRTARNDKQDWAEVAAEAAPRYEARELRRRAKVAIRGRFGKSAQAKNGLESAAVEKPTWFLQGMGVLRLRDEFCFAKFALRSGGHRHPGPIFNGDYYAGTVAKACLAAAIVCCTSCSVWAAPRKAASNCDGGR